MAVDFPNSPTTDQLFATSSKVFKWDGAKWTLVGANDSWNADGGTANTTYGGIGFTVDGGTSLGY